MTNYPDWLNEEGLQQCFAATRAAGGEARVVGGAVRDFLLGIPGADVDLASTLTPEQTMQIAAAHHWKAIPTGIDHGTVTLVLPERVVEVTTLRRDVATDGRHATVAYTDNWQEDAARRDFTMNALYMDSAGHIHDFHDGQKDIASHRVAFIGDATTRITEDGLRSLRFFRFLATHGKPPADTDALAAITATKEIITKLSGERIANEMRKLLSAENPSYAVRLMAETGIADHVFGSSIEPSRMIRLHLLENQSDYQASVWARVVALLKAGTATPPIAARWKLSRHEAQQLKLLTEFPPYTAAAPRHTHTRLIRLHGAPAYLDWLLMNAAQQTGIDVAPYVTLAHDFKPPTFPVSAKDLMEKGMKEGKALGDKLSLLEIKWEESDYTLTKEQLLN